MAVLVQPWLTPALPAPGAAPRCVSATPGWQHQFFRAQSALPERLQPALGAAAEPDRAQALEPCGVPAAAPPVCAAVAAAAAAGPPAVDAEAEAPPAGAQPPQRPAGRAPLRLHVESAAGQGMTVWLGLDAPQPRVDERASGLLATLRQAVQAASPEPLAAVVCNGVLVYAAAPAAGRIDRSTRPVAPRSMEDHP
jgi:hypothetical protein